MKNLKGKGYQARLLDYPAPKKGEYEMRTNVRCGLHEFNPYLSNCETKVTITTSEGETIAEGVSSNVVNFGVYAADLRGAIRDLPDCSQL